MKSNKRIWQSLIVLIAIFVLWNSFLLKPLKVFTVYLHELGHFMTAKLLGYQILEFQVSLNESGYVRYMTQNQNILKNILVASAGYLGSLLFAVIILTSRNTRYRRTVLIGFTSLFFLISLVYSGLSFTLLFSVLLAGFVFGIVKLDKPILEETILEIVGFASIIYAVQDTFVDTILYYFIFGKSVQSDAVALQTATFIPAPVWGIVWTLLSILIVWKILKKELITP